MALGDFTSTGGPDAEALAAGVKAGIATALANQTGFELVSDTREADFVITAALQAHGGRYRASSRILDTSTGQHFAAVRFDGSLEDPFAAEDELTYRVYNTIRFGLHRREGEMAEHEEDSDEALILQAGTLMFRPEMEGFHRAGALLDRVLANSPQSFMPLAMRAMSHCAEFFAGYGPMSAEAEAAALELSQRAVRLNGNSDYAHWVRSMVLLSIKRDHEAADAEALLSLELNPYYAFGTMGRGLIAIAAGRVDEGIALASKVASSDPRVQIVSWASQTVALGHLAAGRHREAVEWAIRSDRRQSDVARTLLILASAAALAGDTELARATAKRIMARHPEFRIAAFGNWAFRDPEPASRLIEGLRLAGLPD